MDDNIRWTVTDPIGKTIVLKKNTFNEHIRDDHATKDAANRAAIEEQVKFTLHSPRFVVKDRKYAGNRKYLDLVDVPEEAESRVRTLTVIVDENDEVITWIPKRSINEGFTKGEEIYDARVAAEAGL